METDDEISKYLYIIKIKKKKRPVENIQKATNFVLGLLTKTTWLIVNQQLILMVGDRVNLFMEI